ncbi:tetracenomycin polyketide synthesis O-methyltransferase TcmP [Xylariaceae sp. FL0016]|nr:tetracenomycin polyketide synthesis O-methyltransferase TcmP [Xylariaceae sp. FL0016]
MDATKFRLSPVEETMLGTLAMRAQDAQSENPILGDSYALQVLQGVDCSFNRGMASAGFDAMRYVIGRAKQLDVWCQDFVDRHDDEPVTVLHLGCGLDSRCLRVRWGKNVKWVDLDRPDVVGLRDRLMEMPSGDYSLIAASVTEESWLSELPSNRPTCIIAEGLLMYLDPEAGRSLINRLVNYIDTGDIYFDVVGSIMKRFYQFIPFYKACPAVTPWAVDSWHEFKEVHNKIRFREKKKTHEFMQTSRFHLPLFFGLWTYIPWLLPSWKTNTQVLALGF